MKELELQKKIFNDLKKLGWIKKVHREFGYLSGVTDIVAKSKKGNLGIEVKLKLNNQIFQQLEKQKMYYEYLIAYSQKPKKIETIEKWTKIAKEKNINLLFSDQDIKKLKIKKFIKNPYYNKRFAERVIYDI